MNLNQNGLALPMTLTIVAVLTALTMGLLTLVSFEPAISRNLSDSAQARYAAEAGIEWAWNSLSGTGEWDTVLVNAPPPPGGNTLTSNTPIPGLGPAMGTFQVGIRNDTLPGDQAITGVAPGVDAQGAESAVNDANGAVIVTATGSVRNATKILQVAVKKGVRPPFHGALSFPGNESEVAFSSETFEISGHGWKTDGSADPACASVLGVSVSSVLPTNNPGGNEGVVQGALTSTQKDNVRGKKENPSGTDQGDNTIDINPDMSPAKIKAFIDQAKQNADVVLPSNPPAGLSFTSPSWGTPTEPKIVYVKGQPDPSSQFSALNVYGPTTGYGVLIVEDGDFRIHGDFTWNGPIIVTGQYVGVGFMGGGNQTVYGAVISNETSVDPGFREGVLTGNAKIKYSCEALNAAFAARKLTTVSNWREVVQ